MNKQLHAKQKSTMVRTPLKNIPIGEATKTEDGHYGLRLKKPNAKEYEVISLDTLYASVVQAVGTSI